MSDGVPPTRAASGWLGRFKQAIALVALVVAVAVVAVVLTHGEKKPTGEHWAFEHPTTPADLGLVPHSPASGEWVLEEHDAATGGRALTNLGGTAGAPPAILVSEKLHSRDIKTKTRCQFESPARPAACGLVFRFIDAQNYWLARAASNQSGDVVEAVTVTGGKERLLKRSGPVKLGDWISLDVEARGDRVTVLLDGAPAVVVDAPAALAGFGVAGLWAPSETRAVFDHFTVETLSATPRSLEILPVIGQKGR